MATTGKAELTYFDGRGRAEQIRLLLNLVEEPFDDKRIAFPELAAIKASGDSLYGQVPMLKIDGKTLVQTPAIMRYIGATRGVAPKTPESAYEGDQVWAAVDDFSTKIGEVRFKPPEDAARIERVKEWYTSSGVVEKYFPVWEATLKKSATGWLGGVASPSPADVVLFGQLDFLGSVNCGSWWPATACAGGKWPVLKAFYDKFAAIPAITAYLAARPASVW